MLKALRMIALPALISTAASTSQRMNLADLVVEAVHQTREFQQCAQFRPPCSELAMRHEKARRLNPEIRYVGPRWRFGATHRDARRAMPRSAAARRQSAPEAWSKRVERAPQRQKASSGLGIDATSSANAAISCGDW